MRIALSAKEWTEDIKNPGSQVESGFDVYNLLYSLNYRSWHTSEVENEKAVSSGGNSCAS